MTGLRYASALAGTSARIAKSVLAAAGVVTDDAAFETWLERCRRNAAVRVEQIPLDELKSWSTDPRTGDIRHDSGKFFTVQGLDIHLPGRAVPHWSQPIISQPEVGMLGILVKEFGGVLHCLIQAKVEPGNRNGVQLSPTVQATKSNYTRVHGGKGVPYLEYFLDTSTHRVLADVRQSEQGSWFHQKRNRNMIVEVAHDVELAEGFCWLTIGQLHRLLAIDDLVNMDARTVLSCLPFAGRDVAAWFASDVDDFTAALLRSCDQSAGSVHTSEALLSWVTQTRTLTDVRTRSIPLNEVEDWRRHDGRISHRTGAFFDVIGVRVRGGAREVVEWTQPMIQPHGMGLVAFLVKRVDGVLHALVHARAEPGYLDVIELAPSVQCTPDNYRHLPAAAQPPFLAEVSSAPRERIRFEAVLSEEGGRFYHARNRYLIVEMAPEARLEHPDYRWVALHQLADLLRHSHYVNVQARSLVACMHSLS